jgi:hypothetical protein
MKCCFCGKEVTKDKFGYNSIGKTIDETYHGGCKLRKQFETTKPARSLK